MFSKPLCCCLTLCVVLLMVHIALIPDFNSLIFVHATSSECRHPEDGRILLPKGHDHQVYGHPRDSSKEEDSLISETTHEESTTTTTMKNENTRTPIEYLQDGQARLETVVVRSLLSHQANRYIFSNPYHFHLTGPTDLELKDRQAFRGKDSTKCVACRLDCLGEGSIFSKCKQRYYYYGCQRKGPCYEPLTASRTIIEAGIGICIDKNGCVLKSTGISLHKGKQLLNQVIKTARYELGVERYIEMRNKEE